MTFIERQRKYFVVVSFDGKVRGKNITSDMCLLFLIVDGCLLSALFYFFFREPFQYCIKQDVKVGLFVEMITFVEIFKLDEMNQRVITPKAPVAIGPYSQAIRTENFVFVSGQLPLNPETGMFPSEDIRELTRQALTNIKNILAEAGMTMANVVKTTVMMADMADFSEMNEVYAEFFSEPFPARSAFAIKELPKGGKLEIECIAAK